jgi:hypothetical protein
MSCWKARRSIDSLRGTGFQPVSAIGLFEVSCRGAEFQCLALEKTPGAKVPHPALRAGLSRQEGEGFKLVAQASSLWLSCREA